MYFTIQILVSEAALFAFVETRKRFTTRRLLVGLLVGSLLVNHELCGFLSPSANHFCRVCLIHRKDINDDDDDDGYY